MKNLEELQTKPCLIQLDTTQPIIQVTKKEETPLEYMFRYIAAEERAKLKANEIMELIQDAPNPWDLVHDILTDIIRDGYLMEGAKNEAI